MHPGRQHARRRPGPAVAAASAIRARPTCARPTPPSACKASPSTEGAAQPGGDPGDAQRAASRSNRQAPDAARSTGGRHGGQMIFKPDEVDAARQTVYAVMPPTPQYAWPMLRERLGMKVWVKHENHTPAGAFKVRGGLTYFSALAAAGGGASGVITATRGNHGQSVGFGARKYGLAATIVVPHGNSRRKERGDARPGRHAHRAWRRLPGGARTRDPAGGRTGPAHGALVPPRPDQGRDDLLARILRELRARRGTGRGVRADRPGIGVLRRGRGPQSTPARARRWSAWCRRTRPPTSTPSAPRRVVEAPVSTRCWPTAWPAASPTRRRWRSCCAKPMT